MPREKARGPRNKKAKTVNKSRLLALVSFFVLATSVIMLVFVFNPAAKNYHFSTARNDDEFYGILLRGARNSGPGTVKADLDCTGKPSSITCRAIIKMDSGDIVEFKYTHDMTYQPCLSPGDRVLLEVLEGNYGVRLVRLSDTN